jgi:hypothetical protein
MMMLKKGIKLIYAVIGEKLKRSLDVLGVKLRRKAYLDGRCI